MACKYHNEEGRCRLQSGDATPDRCDGCRWKEEAYGQTGEEGETGERSGC